MTATLSLFDWVPPPAIVAAAIAPLAPPVIEPLAPPGIEPPAPEFVQEAAFRLYQRHIRATDEWTARRRFERLPQLRREEWEGDAKTVIRITEVHLS